MLPTPPSASTNPVLFRAQQRRGRVGLYFVAALSVLAGMTDAVGFMATGDFVSFMSGNTTRLAVALGAEALGTSARLALLIVAFVLGNALGVILARASRRRAWPLLAVVAVLLGVAGALCAGSQVLALCVAIISIGMLNAVVEQVNGLPIGLTYITGALSRFGRGLGRWLMGERQNGWRVQLIPWAGMFVGAIAGAALERWLGGAAFVACGGFAAVLGMLSLRIPRRWQLGYMPR